MLSFLNRERLNVLNEHHSFLFRHLFCLTNSVWIIYILLAHSENSQRWIYFSRVACDESEVHWDQMSCPENTQMVSRGGSSLLWCPSSLFLLSHTASQDGWSSRCLIRLLWHSLYSYQLEFCLLSLQYNDRCAKGDSDPLLCPDKDRHMREALTGEESLHVRVQGGALNRLPPLFCSTVPSRSVFFLICNHLSHQTKLHKAGAITMVFTPLFLVPSNKYLLNEWILSEVVIYM